MMSLRPDFSDPARFYSGPRWVSWPIDVKKALLLILGITVAQGCQGPWPAGKHAQTHSAPAPVAKAKNEPGEIRQASATDLASLGIPSEGSAAKTQEQAMTEVLSDLEAIGAIDPGAKQELLADLREAKPENWSLIVQQFRSALAYRQQLAAKESKAAAAESIAPQQLQPLRALPVSHETSKKSAAVESSDAEPLGDAVVVSDAAAPLEQVAKPLPKPTLSTPQQTIVVAAPTHHAIEQVSYEAPVTQARHWHEHLQASITELKNHTTEAPSNTAEVHDHMRLRMLQMLAEQENDAMTPIPGASSMQQDYWAKQLFAVSTFLDSERQPDNKRRAAGSLTHLDHARAHLSEMANLRIRNLLFVDSVDGYGVYQTRDEGKFRPGDQVTLYTEVENFRSESTKEGYRTALGTSYEVTDTKGQRVDSAQFPDVEDLCQNRRRDFHMQYGVALPTRIYPGEYELRITITDQLSHKISQQSVPFEIVE